MPSRKPRWSLIKIEMEANKVHVMDHFSKRPRFYGVPGVVSANVSGSALTVNTLHGKVMQINLHDGSRQFIYE